MVTQLFGLVAQLPSLVAQNYKNVDVIGQGFADEIFRVWARKNREVNLKFKNANSFVRLMILRVEPPENVGEVL